MFRVLVCCVLLAGCASTRTGCLPERVYSPQEQKELAAAVGGLDANSPLVRAMEDYGALRAANRACLGK